MKKLLILFIFILAGCISTQQVKTQQENFIELVNYDLAYQRYVPGYITNKYNIAVITSLSNEIGDIKSSGYIHNFEKYTPGLGYSKKYNIKDTRIHADVFTYHQGIENISNGISSKEFDIAYNTMTRDIKSSKVYKDMKNFNEKTVNIKGIDKSVPFKQFTFEGKHIDTGDILISHAFITCHFNTFLKIRISYGENIKEQGKEMMNKFMRELVVNIADFKGTVSEFENWKNSQTTPTI